MLSLNSGLHIILFALCFCSCKAESGKEQAYNGSKTSIICLNSMETINLLSEEEGPDVIKMELYSTDDKLNQLLDSALIEELIVRYHKEAASNDEDVTHNVRVIKVKEALYRLTYMTSFFIDYPIDIVRENALHFIGTTQIFITNKQGEQWEVIACSRVH